MNGAAIASSPASSSTYGLSETIEVAVTFTRLVTVTGTPQLALGDRHGDAASELRLGHGPRTA